jgi:hypothetical protein
METMIATSLAIFSTFVATSAMIYANRAHNSAPAILVYDPDDTADQIEPYAAAGQNPIAVIDTAIDRAIDQGYIVLSAQTGVKAPSSAKMVLTDFVAVGGPVGADNAPSLSFFDNTSASRSSGAPSEAKELQSTSKHLSIDSEPQAIGADVADVARQLYGPSLRIKE